MTRFALIASKRTPLSTVQRFLPSNYTAAERADGAILISGEDNAGWTLEDYVIPRLSSGMIVAREIPDADATV